MLPEENRFLHCLLTQQYFSSSKQPPTANRAALRRLQSRSSQAVRCSHFRDSTQQLQEAESSQNHKLSCVSTGVLTTKKQNKNIFSTLGV